MYYVIDRNSVKKIKIKIKIGTCMYETIHSAADITLGVPSMNAIRYNVPYGDTKSGSRAGSGAKLSCEHNPPGTD
jgi:hypothetical protein